MNYIKRNSMRHIWIHPSQLKRKTWTSFVVGFAFGVLLMAIAVSLIWK